jgi:hypothetical protein
MEHYVTLFDSLFLPQGLSLWQSMNRHISSFTLWILCVDDETYIRLERIGLENVRLLRLSLLETEELKEVKKTRSKGEYCWTITPFAPGFVFDADENIKRVTYLDADMWFRKTPSPIFDEFDKSGKAVLITDHNYDAEYDQSKVSGQFCVQFMIFERIKSHEVRVWWSNKCLDWCYARPENGRFGDQKYLEEWPKIYPDLIHILKNKEWLLAPWNAKRFPYGNSICWHFHGLRLLGDDKSHKVYIGEYELPNVVITNIYKQYLHDMSSSIAVLHKFGYEVSKQIKFNFFNKIRLYSKKLIVKLKWSRSFLSF